ncbi:MAG: hypothetical protein FWD56_05210 [Bacteroidales bacterium]|nr:hypothetical protein [Bacteroidales bacterium]
MNKNLLVLAISLFAVNVYAQSSTQNEYKNFDISKYKTPDIVRNQLNTTFNFNSDYSLNDHFYPNGDSRGEGSNTVGDISSTFSRYMNTRKRISTLSSSLSFGVDYSSNSTTDDSESTMIQRNNLGLLWSEKWYFSESFYMNYGLQSYLSYHFTQEKSKIQTEEHKQKENDFIVSASPYLGVGYGRIESVRDARQAVYIADALSKKQVLSRNLSNDELFELSQIISTVKNKRFLDARLHLIEEISTINSFFEDNDLLEENGAAYFTTLYDMWQYGSLFSRNSGYEVSFDVSPYYSHRNVKNTPIVQDFIYNSNQHIANIVFKYEKPYKLNWLHTLAATISGGINASSTKVVQTDSKNSSKYNSCSASAQYSLGYYPNTRTNIRASTVQQISKNVYDDDRSSTSFYSSLGAGLYYYFSPNLRLSSNCNLIYLTHRLKNSDESFSNRNGFSTSLIVQLNYFIF